MAWPKATSTIKHLDSGKPYVPSEAPFDRCAAATRPTPRQEHKACALWSCPLTRPLVCRHRVRQILVIRASWLLFPRKTSLRPLFHFGGIREVLNNKCVTRSGVSDKLPHKINKIMPHVPLRSCCLQVEEPLAAKSKLQSIRNDLSLRSLPFPGLGRLDWKLTLRHSFGLLFGFLAGLGER